MEYFLYAISMMFIYAGLAQMLHLQFGLLGIPNFGVVGFWGAGLYLTGIFVVQAQWPLIMAIAAAVVLTGACAWLLGRLLLRHSGQAILCGTLAFSAIVYTLVISEKWLTNGVKGLGTISLPWPDAPYAELRFALTLMLLLAALIWASFRLGQSRMGRQLLAIRDNAELAASLGKDVTSTKLGVFALTCGGMALFGGLTAPLKQFLDPALLVPTVTISIWIALALGGKAHSLGALMGVLLTFGLFDIVIETYAPVPQGSAALVSNLKLFFYGLLLVMVILFKPAGLLGRKPPRAKMVKP